MRNGDDSQQPLIGILGWEAGNVDTLAQLEKVLGNIAHPETFDFPVDYERITGAHYQTVVVQPNAGVLASMVDAARAMERRTYIMMFIPPGMNMFSFMK